MFLVPTVVVVDGITDDGLLLLLLTPFEDVEVDEVDLWVDDELP